MIKWRERKREIKLIKLTNIRSANEEEKCLQTKGWLLWFSRPSEYSVPFDSDPIELLVPESFPRANVESPRVSPLFPAAILFPNNFQLTNEIIVRGESEATSHGTAFLALSSPNQRWLRRPSTETPSRLRFVIVGYMALQPVCVARRCVDCQ